MRARRWRTLGLLLLLLAAALSPAPLRAAEEDSDPPTVLPAWWRVKLPPPAKTAPPLNVAHERQVLWESYVQERNRIAQEAASGAISQEKALALTAEANERRFAAARARGKDVEKELREIRWRAARIRREEVQAQRARTGRKTSSRMSIENTGTPLTDPTSRGVFGDQDLTFASEADRAAFARAARERGYSVKGKLGEGYITIEELDVVAHGPSRIPKNPLDPQARLETYYRASGHESFAARGSRFPYLKEGTAKWSGRDSLGAVADNLKKVEHDLGRNLDSLQGLRQEESLQNLAKGTMRAMEGSGKKLEALEAALHAAERAGDAAKAGKIREDLEFLKTLKALKSKMDPRAVGLVPVGTGESEAAAILKGFQERCLGQYHEAFQAGVQANRELIAAMDTAIAEMRKTGKARELSALMAERAAIIDGAAQSVQHLRGSEEGARLLAETIRGARLTPTTGTNGARLYRDAAGRIFSEAEVRAAGAEIMDEARMSLRGRGRAGIEVTHEGPLGEAPAGSRMSKFDRGMLYLQAVMAGLEGATAESEVARQEGRAPSNLLAVLRGWWAMTGIQQGYETGAAASRQAIQEEFDRIEAMIRRGEDPNLYWSSLRSLSKSLGYTVGALTGATGALEGGTEFASLIKAAYEEMTGPPGSVDDLVRARAEELLAALKSEAAELETWLPQLEELYPEARDKAAEVGSAVTPFAELVREFEQTRRGVAEYDQRCTEDNLRLQEIEALRQKIPAALQQARDASLAVYEGSGSLCRAAVSQGREGFSDDWSALQERNLRRVDAVRELSAQRRQLRASIEAHNEAAPNLEVLAATYRPQNTAAALAGLLDDVSFTVEQAAEPVDRLRFLSEAVLARAQGMRRRAEMLLDADVHEEAALELLAQADRAADKIKAYGASTLEKTVAGALGKAYEQFEQLNASAENLQATLDEGCVSTAEVNGGDLEKEAAAADTLFAQADRVYAGARECAQQVLGSSVDPVTRLAAGQLPSRLPLAPTGAGLRPASAKPSEPWVYKEIKPPAYLYRFKREDHALGLYHGVFDRDSNGAFLIGDGTGGVYHEAADLYGPYPDEAALCAVLRGMGKDLMCFNIGSDCVRCPKEGDTADPVPATLGPVKSAATGTAQAQAEPAQPGLVKGPVRRSDSAGATVSAGTVDALRPGSLQTGPDGEAAFRTPAGTTVTLGAATRVTVGEPDARSGRRRLELLGGRVDVNHSSPGEDDILVHSAEGTIVAEGTKYRVEREAGVTRVQVFEGRVRLTGDSILRLSGAAGERGKPSPARELSLAAGERALLMGGTAEQAPNTLSWLGRGGSAVVRPGPSSLPSWLGGKDKAPSGAVGSPLEQRSDPWNDPRVQQLMDQWIARATPDSRTPGVTMRYNEWLQPLSQGARSTGAPEHPADWTRYRYVWENRMRYGSTNLCTLGEFLEASLSGRNLAGCSKNPGAAPARTTSAPAWLAAPAGGAAGGGAASRRGDDLVESVRSELAREAALPPPRENTPPAPPKPAAAAPQTQRRSDDVVASKPPPKPPQRPPQFAGDWDCTLAHPDGRTATALQHIVRDRAGGYRLWVVEGEQFPAKYVDGNRIGFVIGDGTTEKDIFLDFEVNGNVAAGTDRVEWHDGRKLTYGMRCTRISDPDGKH